MSRALGEAWGLEVTDLRLEPKGFGSFHWAGGSPDGRRWFVKLDGLEGKPYLGDEPSSARHGLVSAYTTALLLERAGLACVVAPVPTLDGEVLVPVGETWTLAVFHFVDGTTGEWGHRGPAGRRRQLARSLADLHGVTPGADWGTPRRGWEVPGRAGFDAALAHLGATWTGGPFAEPARRALQENGPLIREWLDRHDAVAPEMAAARPDLVVTHGEPHPGNVMTVEDEVRVIDWDTVALAPAERDLWMFDNDTDWLGAYEEMSGRTPDRSVMAFYRLTWALADLAAFTEVFRRPHERNRVTEKSLKGLLGILDGSEPAPYGTRE